LNEGAIKDSVTNVEVIADYLLYCLKKLGSANYRSLLGIEENPSGVENIQNLLEKIARKIGAKSKEGSPNTELAARYFLEKYRQGKLGRFTLETVEEEIEYQNQLLEEKQQQQPPR